MRLEAIWRFGQCCLLLVIQCRPILCLVTYYMMERCPQNLLKMTDFKLSAARLRLTHENQLYRKDMLCFMSIRAPKDHQLLVQFLDMEIEGFMTEGCESDYMVIYDGPDDHSPSIKINTDVIQYTKAPDSNRLCGTLVPRTTFVTTGDTVTFKFYSDRTKEYRGFDLIVTSFHTGKCVPGEFSCTNGRCINATLQCNDYNNCGDDSDWCGPNTTLVILIIVLCVSVFLVIMSAVLRCSFMERVKKLKKKPDGPDSDLNTIGTGMRIAAFRRYSRRDSSNSRASSEPQQEPLLKESTSSV